MVVIKKYSGDKTYMYPSGAIAAPDIIESHFPAIKYFSHIIETDESEEVLFAIENLSASRTRYNIDPSLTEDEAIKAIEDIRNAPSPDPVMSPEEMLAAAIQEYTAVAEARLLMDM